jgi:hypothetical protein
MTGITFKTNIKGNDISQLVTFPTTSIPWYFDASYTQVGTLDCAKFPIKNLIIASHSTVGDPSMYVYVDYSFDGVNWAKAIQFFELKPSDGYVYRYLHGDYKYLKIYARTLADPSPNDAPTLDVTFDGSSLSKYDQNGFAASNQISRGADTTPYTAGDVVGYTPLAKNFIFAFNTEPLENSNLMATSARILFDTDTVPTGMGSFRLHLYQTAPTPILDNAPFTLAAGDRDKYMGYIDIPTPVALGETIYNEADGVNHKITTSPTGRIVYGILQTLGAYTPLPTMYCTLTLSVSLI